MSTMIRLGISACLLGQAVRYDGGLGVPVEFHTKHKFLSSQRSYILVLVSCPD
jgi:uncharacterized protein YbbK (DUF523 family)